MTNISSSSQKHVAVLAFPFATHAGLLLGLISRLAKAAPNVTFSFLSTAKSNASLFSSSSNIGDDNVKAYDVPNGVPDGYVFAGRPMEDIDLFLKVAPENFRRAMEAAERDTRRRVSCVVADAFLWFSSEIAEKKGVSWVPVWTSAAGSLSIHFYTELMRQTLGTGDGIAGREDELVKFIPGFSEVRLGDLPSGVVCGDMESPFSVMLYKMGQTLPRANALPINSFEELDPPVIEDLKSKFKNVLNVGPFNLTSPPPLANISDVHGCIPWLDKQKLGSVVYIGFGTMATPPAHELKALAEALEASNTPFLWSLKDNFKSNLPDGFLERTNVIGKIVPWAPQVQVLAHHSIGAFVNHSGWNSVLESISAGVPIICRPFFGDHQLNSWMVEKIWKIGVRIEGGSFTKDATALALELVLSSAKGKKLKEHILTYKELALKAVGPNGRSTKNFEILVEMITN
ncbi:kaempferol 3-O-beta-D-galactosyltransferase-like [Coffea arabica]|uniref:Kaempferol 3-O-beta-D-galactosyltransferase-like n=1 Tax=Coffea arabica TaxID=13443 RepID=A0A6P6T416_COFAR